MPTPNEWRALIEGAVPGLVRTITAQTFLKRWGSYSQPVAVSCDDGGDYVIKGSQVGRAIINDHVVGRLGPLLGAPTGEVVLVDATALCAVEPQLAHIAPGLAHGTRLIPNTSDRLRYDYASAPENRPRFAALCVLYSWAGCFQDQQFIYEDHAPHVVYSVDHGHFFPGGPNWTIASLAGGPGASLDADFAVCALTHPELRPVLRALTHVDPNDIAQAVAGPPATWNLDITEKVALADYLLIRRSQLLAATAHIV